jgi:hypothetical protein
MQNSSDQDDLKTLAAIMAELRADAKPLAEDLIRGVNSYALLGIMSAVMTGATLFLALMILFPQWYAVDLGNPIFGAAWLLYPAVGAWVTFKALRRYRSLTKKYSLLIAASRKLGD